MALGEVLSDLKSLTRREKIDVIQFLIAELEAEESPLFDVKGMYEVWTPLDGGAEAAVIMGQFLEEQQGKDVPL